MKTVLITGSSRGIGSSLAIELAKLGYNIAINYNKNKTLAELTAQACTQTIPHSSLLIPNCYQADVSSPAQVAKMINAIPHIDILINNAGISQQKLFTDITEQDWDNMFATNVKGAFNCTKAVLPQMLARNSGQIINITSIHGENPAACEAHYSASKAALIALTHALQKEYSETNIKFSHIPLPTVDTDMHKQLKLDYKNMTGFDFAYEQTPLTPTQAANYIIEKIMNNEK